MKYHLHRQDQEALNLPLEELARRRQAGELTGSEMVWREGMTQWEPLDKILALQAPPTAPLPPPLPDWVWKKRRNRTILITSIIIAAIVIVGVFALAVIQLAKDVRNTVIAGVGEVRSDALDAASAPVAESSTTLTATVLAERKREFRMRQYLEGYLQNGNRHPAIDAKAIGFITNWINSNYNGPVNTNLPPIGELADSLANDPHCTDPMILTIAAVNTIEMNEWTRRLERAVAGYRQSHHTAYPKFYAVVTLSSSLRNDRMRQSALDAEALAYFKQLLKEELSPQDQNDLAENLINGWAKGFLDRKSLSVCDAVQNAGSSYEWLALVLRGNREIDEAWRARGGGFANSVSEDGWRGFTSHLQQARKHLSRAWELQPDSPLAASRMIYVSLGDADITEMRRWFDRAVAAQIDYAPAWAHIRWGLRPRWYGDEDSMLAFGKTALRTHRFDTDVPRMLFDSIADLESEMQLPPGEHIFGHDDIWPLVEEMYDGYIKAAPSSEARLGWRRTYSVVACLGGKFDVSRRQLELADWNISTWHMADWGTDLSLMPLEVAARTGPLASAVEKAESQFRAGFDSRALSLYEAMSGDTRADERTRTFIAERIATLRLQTNYDRCNWVDLMPVDEALTGWQPVLGEWKRLDDGSLEATSSANGHMIYSRLRTGRSFEVKGEFEVEHSSTKAFQAGLVMGLPNEHTDTWYGFRVKRNSDEGDVASYSDGWTQRQSLAPATIHPATNTFAVRVKAGLLTASVNGKEVFRDVNPPRNKKLPADEFYIGLGAFNDMNNTIIRYRNVQTRLLNEP